MISLFSIFAVILLLFIIILKKHIRLPFIYGGIGFLIFAVAIVFSVKIVKGFVPVPIGIRHFYHMVITPKDLYHPIVVDNFFFHKQGFSKTYLLNPKYLDYYDIGFMNNEEDISSKYKFTGKLLVEFLHKDQVVFNLNSRKSITMKSG